MTQTSPIIIYAYTTLTVVAFYGNYMLVILGIQTLMIAIFNSMNAGVGNLVAEGDRKRILSVFEELFSVEIFVYLRDVFWGIYAYSLIYNLVDRERICARLHDVVIDDCHLVYQLEPHDRGCLY